MVMKELNWELWGYKKVNVFSQVMEIYFWVFKVNVYEHWASTWTILLDNSTNMLEDLCVFSNFMRAAIYGKKKELCTQLMLLFFSSFF